MTETLGQCIIRALRSAAQAFAPGDQVAPCAVLWPDPETLWESVIASLQTQCPELYRLGKYSLDQKSGPAIWLRCLEGRVLKESPSAGVTAIFYLPGVSRDQLKEVEDCPKELMALVEMQFRGSMWLHINGKEWTPYAFLVSEHGGLGLDLARDQGALTAIQGALPILLDTPLTHLRGRTLDAAFFNELVAPDATGLLLRWLSDPAAFRQRVASNEWKAFRQQCKSDFELNPEQDGPLKAAELLAQRKGHWGEAWKRFAEMPTNYPGIVDWLKKAAPKSPTMFDSAEVWPQLNQRDERQLYGALKGLADRPPNEVISRLAELETQHGMRRGFPWQKLGLSPLATALKPLVELAHLCKGLPGSADSESYAKLYVESGWKTDAAALAAMNVCEVPDEQEVISGVIRAIYLPWLEATSRHLQTLVQGQGQGMTKRLSPPDKKTGRVILFADGLRYDVARQLSHRLAESDLKSALDWDWATIPSVTASAKPAVSPVASLFQGGEASEEFSASIGSTHQRLTHDRFVSTLKQEGWQVLSSDETGDPAGSAWTEVGNLDKRGHSDGWKLTNVIESEVKNLANRIAVLLKAGWSEVIIVTDHGWQLVPGGLPKIELKAFLAEHRWGRCAILNASVQVALPAYKWYWNPNVTITCPPGVGCFRASMEYSHGGVSLQESVIPRLNVTASVAKDGPHLVEAKWTGARCRVLVGGHSGRARIDLRTRRLDSATSLLADKQSCEINAEGRATLFLEDATDINLEAEIVLLDETGQVIDSMSVKIGS